MNNSKPEKDIFPENKIISYHIVSLVISFVSLLLSSLVLVLITDDILKFAIILAVVLVICLFLELGLFKGRSKEFLKNLKRVWEDLYFKSVAVFGLGVTAFKGGIKEVDVIIFLLIIAPPLLVEIYLNAKVFKVEFNEKQIKEKN